MPRKIENLYNKESFKKFCQSGEAVGFQDAAPGVILARNLEHVDPKIFEKKFPEMIFLNNGIDVDNSGGFVDRVTSLRVVDQGGFKNAGDDDTNQGKISLKGEDNTIPVLEREAESDWKDTDIKKAELQGINLPNQFLSAHNKIYNREIDRFGYVGFDSPAGAAKGLGNNTFFDSSAAAGLISTLTSLQMYEVFAELINNQKNDVGNTAEYMATYVDMPNRVFNTIEKEILDTAASEATVLTALRKNFPEITFRGTTRLDVEANGGDLPDGGSGSATVAYNPNEEAMKFRVPHPLEIGEIIKVTSFKFHVESKYRLAGLDILEATAGRILTGL